MERRFAIDLATRLSLAHKEKTWIYDQSDTLNPIDTALAELELSSIEKAFTAASDQNSPDATLAAEVGKKVGADLILIGSIEKLKIDEEMDNRPAFDMSNQAGISGTTRFILVYQTALVDMHLIAVDVKSGESVLLILSSSS